MASQQARSQEEDEKIPQDNQSLLDGAPEGDQSHHPNGTQTEDNADSIANVGDSRAENNPLQMNLAKTDDATGHRMLGLPSGDRVSQPTLDVLSNAEAAQAKAKQDMLDLLNSIHPAQPGHNENDENAQDADRDPFSLEIGSEAEAASLSNLCFACETELEETDSIYLPCGHKWCRGCLNRSMSFSIMARRNFPPNCCQDRGIDVAAIQHHLDEDILARLNDVYEEFSSPDPTFCANARCSIFVPVDLKTECDQFAQCPKCKEATCTKCKIAKSKHTTPGECPEIMSHEDKSLVEVQGWKQCPTCRSVVSRDGGCDHMTCHCGTDFCYRCGRLGHPEEGRDGMICSCEDQYSAEEGDGTEDEIDVEDIKQDEDEESSEDADDEGGEQRDDEEDEESD